MLKKFFNFTMVFLALSILALYLTLARISVPDGWDKVCHFVVFGLASAILAFTFRLNFGNKYLNHFLFILFLMGGVGAAVSEELQKWFTDYRSFEASDWLANVLGMSVFLALFYFFNILNIKSKKF